MNITNNKYLSADNIGMASSTLCLIHCILTPFIFIAHACAASCCAAAPGWWKAIDLLFLIVSFIAVYYSARTTSKKWLKVAFYGVFTLFSLLLLNEYVPFINVSRYAMYITAGLLAGLHFYNRRYCNCSDENCSK